MKTVIITGMSGAGKTAAVHSLEDMGYYCVDNIPPVLVSSFISLCENSNLNLNKIALVVDARSGELVKNLSEEIEKFRQRGNQCIVLFLEADNKTLIKRYKETRRKHPQGDGGIEEGIESERRLFEKIKTGADIVLDTSALLMRELKEKMVMYFGNDDRKYENISVEVVSFGFKSGIPLDCDLIFDVRFMPNPYYEESLKEKTGKEEAVANYALSCDDSQIFLEKLSDMLDFLLPLYESEGKSSLVIGIGCTGGKHRSVAVAEYIKKTLTQKNYYTTVKHRDIENK